MTTTPDATPTDATGPGADLVPSADLIHVQRADTTATVLAGLLAAGQLATAGTPGALPHQLWPDLPADVVQHIWDTAAAVGYWAGSQKASRRWDTDVLDDLRTQLAQAGYEHMASRVAATAYAAPSRRLPAHPADDDGPARGHHQ